MFTKNQINDWKKYERVRKGGRYNMFFPQARRATGLSKERYSFVLANYSLLQKAAGAVGRKTRREEKGANDEMRDGEH